MTSNFILYLFKRKRGMSAKSIKITRRMSRQNGSKNDDNEMSLTITRITVMRATVMAMRTTLTKCGMNSLYCLM